MMMYSFFEQVRDTLRHAVAAGVLLKAAPIFSCGKIIGFCLVEPGDNAGSEMWTHEVPGWLAGRIASRAPWACRRPVAWSRLLGAMERLAEHPDVEWHKVRI